MGRKRKKKNEVTEILVLIELIIQFIIVSVIRIVSFTYDLVTYHTSKYKQKSGNSFLLTYFNKGNYGEFILYRMVCRAFGTPNVLTNIYLENKNTETTEIDVLAVSNKGVYVFEVKNYAGYIYGSESDQYWTQVLNKWSKHKFYNPLRQNYAHTKALEKYLDISSQQVIPVIIFSNRSKLNKINASDKNKVLQFTGLNKFVKKYEKSSNNVLTDSEKEAYLIRLLDKCNMPVDVKEKHISDIKLLQMQNK